MRTCWMKPLPLSLLALGLILISITVFSLFFINQSPKFNYKDEKIMNEIMVNLRRPEELTKVNYSILTDPYYTVQIKQIDVNADPKPKCVPVSKKFADYKLCTTRPTDPMFDRSVRNDWQNRELATLVRLIQATPNTAYIDLGSNAGLWAVPISVAMQRKIKMVMVEVNPEMIRSSVAGLKVNGIPEDTYAIVQRGISDTVDEKVSFSLMPDSEWTNGGIIEKIQNGANFFVRKSSFEVVTATVDSHVLPVVKAMNITTAIVKMDIEGSECLGIKHARQFLTSIHVPYIMMEHFIPHVPSIFCLEEMHGILTELSYHPFEPGTLGLDGKLDLNNYKAWGEKFTNGHLLGDVLWKKVL